MASPDQRDAFGIIVSYAIKVKLYLGALGGELSAELPFVLMHPKVRKYSFHFTDEIVVNFQPNAKGRLMQADSQADVEVFRQDTVIEPDMDEDKYE